MDICEEIKMFIKPTFSKDEKMASLVRDWKDYDYKIGEVLHDFFSFRDKKTKVSYEREEILPSLLQDENKEGYEELCSKKPTSVHRNLLVIENVNIYVKKVIDDELSPEELSAEIEDFHNEITDEIRESFKQDYCYNYICENKIIELEKIPGWAIDGLYDDLSLAEKDKLKTLNSIKNNDFKSAAKLLAKYYNDSDDYLNFMKEVIKIHGTDTKIINDAISAITETENESPAFMAKLLNDTLKTDEYKKAFEAEQGKGKEKAR